MKSKALQILKNIRKYRKKVVPLVLGMVVILTPIAYLSLKNTQQVKAAWFDDDWAYRKRIVISKTVESQTNVYIEFDGADVLDTSETDKFQGDCGDIRFTKENGEILPYYIVSGCTTSSTDMDVFFDSIPLADINIYMYYGNPSAPNGFEGSVFATVATNYTIGTPAAEEIGPGPVAYWKFDEGVDNTCSGGTNDVCDSTSNANDGALGVGSSSPSWQTEEFCTSGKCLHFSGSSQYVSIADDPQLDFTATNDFTITGWFRHPEIATNPDYLFTKHESGTSGGYKVYMDSDGDIAFGIDDDGTWNPAATDIAGEDLSNNYDDNKWHHFSAVKNDTTGIYLYIDGLLLDSETSLTETATLENSASSYIGVDADGGSNGWEGFLDEIKVYRYARSADEVKADFNEQAGARGSSASFADPQKYLSDGLVGYWKMDEYSDGTGAVTRVDSSGNGHDMTDNNTTASIAGKFGNAGDFSDVDNTNLSTPDTPALSSGNNDYMITAWVYPTGTSGRVILSKYTSNAANNREFRLVPSGGQFSWDWHVVQTITTATATTFGSFSTNNWYFLAAYHDAAKNEIGISVNGGPFDTASVTGGNDSDAAFRIAAVGPALGGSEWDGRIDEVRVYKRLLSPAEVRGLYNWAPGPIGYWDFNENNESTAYDTSVTNANNLTATSFDTTYWVSGKYGSGAEFEDDSNNTFKVTDPADGSLDFGDTDDITVEAWIYPHTLSDNLTILSKITFVSDPGYDLYYDTTSNYITFKVEDSGNDELNIRGITDLQPNTWYHVAAVFDQDSDANSKIYLNGVEEVNTNQGTIGLVGDLSNAIDFNIGKLNGGGGGAGTFDGIIDEVRIYNYARTQAQIIEDMNAGHPAPGSPVGSALLHYKFDEGYGDSTNDFGIGGNNGDLAGSSTTCPQPGDSACPAWTNSGKFGKALDFDTSATTDDYMTIADLGEDSISFTIAAWINLDDFSANHTIYGKWASSSEEEFRFYTRSDGKLVFQSSDNGTCTNSFDGVISNKTLTTTGTWLHVVATFNKDTLDRALYIDGVLDADDTAPAAIPDCGIVAYIGRSERAGAESYFNGEMDDLRVYSSELTADQVKVLYNQGSAQTLGDVADQDEQGFSLGDPVLLWNLDENTGTTANDTSGNDNSGTLTNSPTWVVGKTGLGVNFTGSDQHIIRADDADLDFGAGGSFTLGTWFKHSSASAQEMMIVKFNEAGYKMTMESDGDISCGIDYDSTWTPTDSVTSTAATYDDGAWHYATCIKNANTSLTLYIDGISVGTPDTTLTNSTLENSDPFYVGIDADGTSNDFVGQMDHVVVYHSALSQAQVAWLYNRGAPIGWWKFDECQGSTAYDSSGFENNGNIGIGATAPNTSAGTCSSGDSAEAWNNGTTGKRNASLDFDGVDDYVDYNDPSDLELEMPFSLAAWVNLDTLPSASDTFGVITKYTTSSTNNFTWQIETNDELILFKHDGTSGEYASPTNLIFSSSDLGNWVHVAFTTDISGNFYHYKNGLITGYGTFSSANMNTGTTAEVFIGARNTSGSANYFFDGQIDDVRIYNYALTADQVKNVMNHGAVFFGPSTGSP